MLKNLSIELRLIMLFVASSLILLLTLTGIFAVNLNQSLLSERKVLLESTTKTVYDIVESYVEKAEKGFLTEEDAKAQAMAAVDKVRFLDGRGYFFIYSFDGTNILLPIKKEVEGENLIGLKDVNGVYFVKELIDDAKKDGGFTEYLFKKSGFPEDKMFPKLGYAMGVKEWDWMLGTGDYVDDINVTVFKQLQIPIIVSILLFVALVLFSLNRIQAMVIKPIKKITELSKVIAQNDLTVQFDNDDSNTEIGELNRSFKQLVDNFKVVINQIQHSSGIVLGNVSDMTEATEQTSQGAQQVSESIVQLATGSSEQANYVTDTLTNLNQVNSAIQNVSYNVQSTENLSKSTEQTAQEGKEQAGSAVNKINEIKSTVMGVSTSINELGKLSSEIEQIVDMIKGLASQTNLLALNAAIEAARAGEHGKGFAVVAEEVKKLAGQSADATDKITYMIQEIQTKTSMAVTSMDEAVIEVDDGVKIVEVTGDSLQEIVNAAKSTNEQIALIAAEIDSVSSNSDNIVAVMENISSITEETAASAEEISSISEEQTASLEEIHASAQTLCTTMEDLKKQVEIFRV